MIEKLPLFVHKKEWSIFVISIVVIFFVNLFIEYNKFLDFKLSQVVEVKVLAHYKKYSKNNKEYYVLKCKNDDLAFYTTTWKEFDDLTNKYIKLHIKDTSEVTFFGYLKGFLIYSKKIEVLDKQDTYYNVYQKIVSMHQNQDVTEFYAGMYLDSHIDKPTREAISILGVAHLIAISGFNLSILSSFLFLLLYYPYKFFQQRFFPYRNLKMDMLFIILFILFWYVWFLDYSPSLLRSYVMMVIGGIFFVRYIDIFSFTSLLIVILIITAFAPKMIFSISFWFSIAGVFYIYLFIHYYSHLNKYVAMIFFNFWIYLAMNPIVHYFFGLFSIYQFSSPILSLIFVPFYPLSIVLHLIGYGNVFDNFLIMLLNIKDYFTMIFVPIYVLIIHIVLSIIAIFSKLAFRLLNINISIFLLYCLYHYFFVF